MRIGFSFIDAKNVWLDDNSTIGHFNVIRRVRTFALGERSFIANFNDIFGRGWESDEFPCQLTIGRQVNWMSHHFADVAGVIEIADGATLGGRDSHLWSHTLSLDSAGVLIMKAVKLSIGCRAYVGARVTMVAGSIPDDAFVGAGSVITKDFRPDSIGRRVLIAGNPACLKKVYSQSTVDQGQYRDSAQP